MLWAPIITTAVTTVTTKVEGCIQKRGGRRRRRRRWCLLEEGPIPLRIFMETLVQRRKKLCLQVTANVSRKLLPWNLFQTITKKILCSFLALQEDQPLPLIRIEILIFLITTSIIKLTTTTTVAITS